MYRHVCCMLMEVRDNLSGLGAKLRYAGLHIKCLYLESHLAGSSVLLCHVLRGLLRACYVSSHISFSQPSETGVVIGPIFQVRKS